MRQQGLAVTDSEFLDSFSLDVDDKPARYARLLCDLPAGLSEWAVHPSVGSEESQAIDSGWRVRQTDYEFLAFTDSALRNAGVSEIIPTPLDAVARAAGITEIIDISQLPRDIAARKPPALKRNTGSHVAQYAVP